MLYWTDASWGDACPPADWETVCEKANRLIDSFYFSGHDMDSTKEYSETLWDKYCTTGEVDI